MTASSRQLRKLAPVVLLGLAVACCRSDVPADAGLDGARDVPLDVRRDTPRLDVRRDTPRDAPIEEGWTRLDSAYPEVCPIEVAGPELLTRIGFEIRACASEEGGVFGDGAPWCRRIERSPLPSRDAFALRTRNGYHDGARGYLTVWRDDLTHVTSWVLDDTGRALVAVRGDSYALRGCLQSAETVGDGVFVMDYNPQVGGIEIDEHLIGTEDLSSVAVHPIGSLPTPNAGTERRAVGPAEILNFGLSVSRRMAWDGTVTEFSTEPLSGGVVAPYATFVNYVGGDAYEIMYSVDGGPLQHFVDAYATSGVMRQYIARGGGRLAWYDLHGYDRLALTYERCVIRSALERDDPAAITPDVTFETVDPPASFLYPLVVGPSHVARRTAIAGNIQLEVYRISDGLVARVPPASPSIDGAVWEDPIYVSADEIVVPRRVRDPYPQTLDIRFIRLDALEYVPR